MTEMKSWFGRLDLAYRYAFVFGSLLGLILVLGLVKFLYDRRKLKQHLKLEDEDGRESKDSHRVLNARDKDDGHLFGVRAIEAGYFGGVAQSANNSPNLSPRVSVVALSPTFHGSEHARSTSTSSAFDLNIYGRISAADSYNNPPSSSRQTSLQSPVSPTIPSIAYAVRKTPSPTKWSPISPASSPIQVPSMAHIRQIALRPSTAERTGRHSHDPPIETPIDFRFKTPNETLTRPDILTPPQSPPPEGSKRHARVFSTSDMVTWLDDNEAPQLLLPDFIGSSEHLVPEFDRSASAKRKRIDERALPELESKRASMMNIVNTLARKRSRGTPASPPDTPNAGPSTSLVTSCSTEKHARREAIIPERFLELPATTEGLRAPIPSVIVEGGRFYFDYSKPLTLALPVRSKLSPACSKASLKFTPERAPRLSEDSNEDGPKDITLRPPLTLSIPAGSPPRISPATSKTDFKVNTKKASRLSEDRDEDGDGDITPRASTVALALALPVRSPLRLTPASSRSDLKSGTKEASRLSEQLIEEEDIDEEGSENISPRTSYSYENTLSEYRQGSGDISPQTSFSHEKTLCEYRRESEDISPRTSFSYEKTASEYRRESMIAPPIPHRKYRIGDTPMSSLAPHAMTVPYQTTIYGAPSPANSSRRFSNRGVDPY